MILLHYADVCSVFLFYFCLSVSLQSFYPDRRTRTVEVCLSIPFLRSLQFKLTPSICVLINSQQKPLMLHLKQIYDTSVQSFSSAELLLQCYKVIDFLLGLLCTTQLVKYLLLIGPMWHGIGQSVRQLLAFLIKFDNQTVTLTPSNYSLLVAGSKNGDDVQQSLYQSVFHRPKSGINWSDW